VGRSVERPVAGRTVLERVVYPSWRATPKNQEASVKSAERHLMNVRQLTFGRQNAEAYFSFSGDKLIFQSTNNWMKDSFAATLKPDDAGLAAIRCT
jgi:hypothetical protein